MMDSRPVSPLWEPRRVTTSWRDYLDPASSSLSGSLRGSTPRSTLSRRSRCDLDEDLHDHLQVDHDVTEADEPVTQLGATWRDHLIADVPLAGILAPSVALSLASGPLDVHSDEEDGDLDLDGSADDLFEPFSDTCGECECDDDEEGGLDGGLGGGLDLDLDGLDLALFEPAGSEESSSVCSACCCRCKEELGDDDSDPGLAASVSGSLLYIYSGPGNERSGAAGLW